LGCHVDRGEREVLMNGLSIGESVFFAGLFLCAGFMAALAVADALFVPSLTAGVEAGGPVATAVVNLMS
jgi:hypothetical protein